MSTGFNGTSEFVKVFDPLGENERKDYTADFTLELSECNPDGSIGDLIDTIDTATWTYEPEDGILTLDGQGLLAGNTQALTFASTPNPGTFYRLVCYVVTAGGRQYERAFGIPSQKMDGTK